jgi:hypothetical protein
VTAPAPGRVLRLAVIGWGLGDLAMGRTAVGGAWLVAEVVVIALLTVTTLLFVDTTWYLVPFLLGMAFLLAWAGQAVLAYRHARRRQAAMAPASPGSPALTVAWLTIPLLLWGTGFWLAAGAAATPAAVVNGFVSDWADAEPIAPGGTALPSTHSAAVQIQAGRALYRLQQLCDAGALADDCGDARANLLRDVRFRIDARGDAATAVAELVSYVRQPSTFLGIFQASELVPVRVERILTLQLRTTEAPLGSLRWSIMNAEAG